MPPIGHMDWIGLDLENWSNSARAARLRPWLHVK